jgi:hypothetical protein
MNKKSTPADAAIHDSPPESIAELLTIATRELDTGTVSRLRRARHIALARQSLRKPVLALGNMHGVHWPIPHSAPQWVYAIILLGAILVSVTSYWHHAREHEMSHLDIAILTDDLPMEIFVDR